MSIWIHKYAPQTLADVQGQDTATKKLKDYVENYKKGTAPLLVHGPTGVGKTSAIYALSVDGDYEVAELNASDLRNADAINSFVGAAINQMSLFGKKKIVLIDEIDGLSGNKDRGGAAAINKIISGSTFPVILVANDVYKKSLKAIKKKCQLLEFHSLAYPSIVTYLKKVIQAEGLIVEEEALTSLARSAGGDLRAAINDLQSFSYKGALTVDDLALAYGRDHTEKITNALLRVFKTTSADTALNAFDEVNEDLDTIFLWVEENLGKEYTKPADLAEAFANVALADKFFGRIRRWQYYRFYVYCYNLLSAGVAIAKKEKYPGFPTFKQNSRILSMWIYNNKNAKKKAIAEKLAGASHLSKKQAFKYVPYLKVYFKANKDQLTNELDLSSEEVAWLSQ